MEDVREYIRDVLIMYSSLQSFQPKPNKGATAAVVVLHTQCEVALWCHPI
jgi:hypothetical protein